MRLLGKESMSATGKASVSGRGNGPKNDKEQKEAQDAVGRETHCSLLRVMSPHALSKEAQISKGLTASC